VPQQRAELPMMVLPALLLLVLMMLRLLWLLLLLLLCPAQHKSQKAQGPSSNSV
jgi:hypothetical protein